MNRWLMVALVAGITLVVDRVTKHIAVLTLKGEPTQTFLADLFRLGYAENPGAFLGLGGGMDPRAQFWIFTIAVGGILLAMAVWLVVGRGMDLRTTAGVSMIVSGGLSNWIDRVFNDGRVVDFLNLGIGSLRTGIFNVADIAIMAGAILIAFFGAKPQKRQEESATA